MKKLLSLVPLVALVCQVQAAPRYPYSATEAKAFLEHLAAHVMIINSDLTLRKKTAANADMASTSPVVIRVSLRDGQVTLATSVRTSRT